MKALAVALMHLALFQTAALAESGIPYVRFPEGHVLSEGCEALVAEARALVPRTAVCERDSDCELFPCSCDAIGSNPAATRYKAIFRSLPECGARIIFPYCGRTTPVCVDGSCDVSSLEELE